MKFHLPAIDMSKIPIRHFLSIVFSLGRRRMANTCISIAGISTLLGKSFLEKLLQHPDIIVESLHDPRVADAGASLAAICDWSASDPVVTAFQTLPLLPADAPAMAPLLVSFLPDAIGEDVEARHLARGTRVVTHCEYARLIAPLMMPSLTMLDCESPLSATPNCTTAICAPALDHLHHAFGVARATITTLQAISGTDLPGMPASVIHDQVIGHLPGEAEALAKELSVLFEDAFPIHTFATRVPVWRGHTITMALELRESPNPQTMRTVLAAAPQVQFRDAGRCRREFRHDAPLTTVLNLRQSAHGVLLVVEGDNLEAATAGVMFDVLRALQSA